MTGFSNKKVLSRIAKAEENILLNADPDLYDYLILIRYFHYFGSRRNAQYDKSSRSIFVYIRGLILGIVYLVKAIFYGASSAVIGSSSHRNIRCKDSAYMSKHMDSLAFYLSQENGQVVDRIEWGPAHKLKHSGQIYLGVLSKFLSIFVRLSEREKVQAERLADYLCSSNEGATEFLLRSDVVSLTSQYQKLCHANRLVFKFLPYKRLFFVCYYSLDALSIIKIAREKDIECFDYQHGIQNEYHPMYADLKRIVKVAPLTIPSGFWVWDDVSFSRLNQAFGGKNVAKVGYLWARFSPYYRRTKNLDRPNRTILIALQGFPDFFDFFIIEALQSLDNSYTIVIKEHPLHPVTAQDKDHYFDRKNYRASISFCEPDVAIESVLADCSVCITGFSTVGIEASYLGITTLFTHQNARQGLQPYLDGRYIRYCGNALSLTKALKDSIALEPRYEH